MIGIVTKCYSPDDVVFGEGEKARDIFYIIQGSVVLEDARTKCVIFKLGKSNYFGEIAFFLDKPRCCSVLANDFLETFIITWDNFSKCIEEEPDAKEFMERISNTFIDEALLELNIECFMCKQIGHISKNCSIFTFGKNACFERWKENRTKRIKIENKAEPRNIPVRFKRFRSHKKSLLGEEDYKKKEENSSLTLRSSSNVNLFLDSSEESGDSLDSVKSEVDVIRKNSFDVSLLLDKPRKESDLS
jgi:hypothetical protein